MKKLVATISVLTYFVMTCGVIVNLHYCMGRVQSMEFYGSTKNFCNKCVMPLEDSKGCCKEEVKILKLQDDQNKAQISFSIKNIVTAVTIPSEFIIASVYNENRSSDHNVNPPPLLAKQDTYLQNCVFRI